MPPHKPEDLHQIVPATLWAIYWLDVAQIYDYVLYISLQWDFEYHHTSETQGFLSQGLYFYFTVTEMRRPAYIEVNGLKVLITFSLKHRVKVAKLPLHLLLLLKVRDGNKKFCSSLLNHPDIYPTLLLRAYDLQKNWLLPTPAQLYNSKLWDKRQEKGQCWRQERCVNTLEYVFMHKFITLN